MNLTRRITLIVTLGLLITGLIGINAYRTTRKLVRLNNKVIHTHLVLQQVQQLRASLINLDNNLRGHLLTDNTYFKADFYRNVQSLTGQFNSLQELTGDNSQQQKRLAVFQALFQTKLVRSKALFAKDEISKGMARLDSIQGLLNLGEQLQTILDRIEIEEKRLLDARAAESAESASHATLSSLVGAITALAMILWAIYLLFQTLKNMTRLNKQLVESEQQAKRFLDTVPISVAIFDKEGRFYYANQAAFDMFGDVAGSISYEETLKAIQLYRYPANEPYPAHERPAYRALRGETVRVDDIEFRLGDKAIQLLSSASPVYDADGVLQYVVSSSVDISERVQSHRRLEEAKELAEQAAGLKESFLANMSHEIRTPLNAMLGFSNLLETTPLTAEQQEFVQFIRTAGKNLLIIVNDILDISKIEAGMLQLETIPFSVRSLAVSVQTMFQAVAAEKGLYLQVEIDPTLPPVVLGDPTRLTQILLNLISNAIKFTKEGGVTIYINKKAQADNAVAVQFTVQDTGIGIAAEALPHVFERFRQASDFTTRFYGGTGLGLNIVKSLTEMQGGSVSVTSTVGQGSRFMLEITYAVAADQVMQGVDPVGALPGSDGWTVLVVEDNAMNQKLALQVLKRLGYRALVAENGQQAIECLLQNHIDIVLMDIQMPLMDGYETTRHIRTTLQSNVPIIAMTAHALASEREQCLRAGMNDFMPKPFQMDELQRVMHKYLLKPVAKAAIPERAAVAVPPVTFSLESLLRVVDQDADFAAEVMDLYLSQAPVEMTNLRTALDQHDLVAISGIAHTQKVPAQMFGMTKATQLLRTIEDHVADQKGIALVEPLVRQYITLVEAELPVISQLLETTFHRVPHV